MSSMLFDDSSTPPRPIMKKQILVHIVDGMANSQPFAVYAEYPYSLTSYEPGFRKVTYKAFANAINGLAWQLHSTLGPGNDFPTLAYIGPNDLRYHALTLACVKVGYKLLLTSPRNSIAAHQNLFTLTDCQVLLHPVPEPPSVKAILASCKLRVLEVPSVDELLAKRYPHYPYHKKFAKARSEPLLVLHTSGSTGLPKPITWTHDYVASIHQWFTLEPPEGFANNLIIPAGARMFVTLPSFHASGVMGACLPILYQTTAVFPLAGAFPSAQLAADALKHTTVDVVLFAPPLVEEMCKNPETFNIIVQNVDSILWLGGPLPKSVGDVVTKRTKLWTMIGMTEGSVLPTIRPEDEWPEDDWQFVTFHPESGIELRHKSQDLYEAVIVRHVDPEKEQPCFKTFPDVTEWSTSDLYSPHPSKPGLWLPSGRMDDIIIFLNGEKTNPISMEHHVANHPEVRAALVVGRFRLEAALLIELETSDKLSTIQRAEAIERIWPTIDEANQECPRHAMVAKSRILFTDPEKPMLRAGKETIQRQPTLNLYATEIEALYNDVEEASASLVEISPKRIDMNDRVAVLAFVRDTVNSLSCFEDSDDFFVSGMDSLQALRITRLLKQSLQLPEFEISTIYTNPTISLLTDKILQLSVQHDDLKTSTENSELQELRAMLKDYTDIVDTMVNPQSSLTDITDNDRVVILTGSTGGIGCYTLHTLLESPAVSHIYCLNRSLDSASLQSIRSGARGLSTHFPNHKVTFFTSDLSKVDLGLGDEIYSKVRNSATDIIHAAWPVNFNLAIGAFRPHLSGVLNLLTLTMLSPSCRSFFFLSSISSVAAYPITPVPEQAISDFGAPAPIGYARSKYLAERILDHAANVLPGLEIKIARVGQVAGPALTDGAWNKWEWVPSLVISSYNLGVIPDSLGNTPAEIDWVPVDQLATVLVDLALGRGMPQNGASFFHPVNPKPTTWKHLLPSVVAAALEEGKPLSEVPFANWLRLVKASARSLEGSNLEQLLSVNPAIKLLDFYESLLFGEFPTLDIEKTVKGSKILKELEGIKGEWMHKWVKGWIKT